MAASKSVKPKPEVLASARKRLGWNQEELAARAECGIRSVPKVEAGQPISPDIAAGLAATVGIPYAHLIENTESMESTISLLPPRPAMIVGRQQVFTDLVERLAHRDTGACSVQAIVAMRGWPGVGKTTVAAELLYRPETKRLFPDGCLWVSLGKSPDVRQLLTQWARALGDEAYRDLADARELSRRLAGMLRNRSLLLTVDDVWSAADARPFLVGGPECGMLLTTRIPRVAAELTPSPADRYHLEVLSEEEGVDLLRRLAYRAVKDASDACRGLIAEVERLPLAIQVAGRLLETEAQRGLVRGEKAVTVGKLLADIRDGARLLLDQPCPADMSELLSQTTPSVAMLLKKKHRFIGRHDARAICVSRSLCAQAGHISSSRHGPCVARLGRGSCRDGRVPARQGTTGTGS